MAQYMRRICLTQVESTRGVNVQHESIRNREQGTRCQTGAARASLRVLGNAPETALRVLT